MNKLLLLLLLPLFLSGCFPTTSISFNLSEYPRKIYASKYCFIGCLKQIKSDYAFEYCSSVCDEDIDKWERL